MQTLINVLRPCEECWHLWIKLLKSAELGGGEFAYKASNQDLKVNYFMFFQLYA